MFFVHGANVSERSARGWASEMFKRLHQAGAVMIFTPVTWYSDAGPSYNYQANVSNAFVTAPRLATAVNEVSGRRVVIAHSLGTLVAASAIQDHGMQVDCLRGACHPCVVCLRRRMDVLLARGVPALSAPMGSEEIGENFTGNESDLNVMAGDDNWPHHVDRSWKGWRHNDIKEIAMPFVFQRFGNINQVLKESR